MYTVKTLNKISPLGLARLDPAHFHVDDACEAPEAILVRSAKMLDYDFPASLRCIARAGAGYNNIPVDVCAEKGIVVFNTPGANANGVKELALCALLLASRDVIGGVEWVRSLAGEGDAVAALVEKGKSAYAGPELLGKTLGLIGAGAIGAKVAEAAHALGMTVLIYDPFLSAQAKEALAPVAAVVDALPELYARCDYLSLHLPYNAETAHTVDAAALARMKDGVRIVNIARGELVDDEAMLAALSSGKAAAYVTDFPNGRLAGAKGVVAIPHLGASTPESEDNCACMAADEVSAYLLRGDIVNSVNFPSLSLAPSGGVRLTVLARSTVEQGALLACLASQPLASACRVRGNYAAAILELPDAAAAEKAADALRALDGVLYVHRAAN